MIEYINISNFMSWFLNEFMTIASNVINWLDDIRIYNNVSLLDFIITITIIEVFITIVLTLPQIANKQSIKAERKERKNNKE